MPVDSEYQSGMLIGMKLGTYLENNEISHTAFAVLIEATQATVSRYVSGARTPDMRMIARIEKATKGKVRVSDWYAQAKEAAE